MPTQQIVNNNPTGEDFITECKSIQDSGFRFQNQRVMLTYKTHIDKAAFWDFLANVGWTPTKIYIAHENGTNDPITPYQHSHCVIDFGKNKQTTNSRFFDFHGIHPHISIIKDKLAWKKACKYVCKEDKTVEGMLHTDDRFDGMHSIWAHSSISEALQHCNLRDAMATIAVYKYKPIEMPEARIDESMFYPWQTEMNKILHMPPDGRKIIWIFEPTGKFGKTTFGEWMCKTEKEKAQMLNNVGRIADFAQNMQNFWSQGWRGDTVFLNLGRSYSDRTNLYEACEIIADGLITCTKYAGGVVWLPKMHIVVLSNFPPLVKNLSMDRWKIYEIDQVEKTLISKKATDFLDRQNGYNPMSETLTGYEL